MVGGGGGVGRGGSSPAIKPINKAVVHRICSGQVIFDLSSAVKELVENSLDAGATSVEVSLKAYGEEWFKVADNGCGISPANFQHHTSKISDFSDLGSVVTFGFRGEALSSLCALGKLTVETRTKDEPIGTHLEFEHSGVVASERKAARQVGTTVTVEKLFSTLPVRSKEFSRNIRKEYGKVISLLNCLEPFSVTISDDCQVEGFLSKPGPGTGRNSGDRQFFYVNGRPVDMPKVTKLVNELYRSSNAKQYPVAILDFHIPTTSYDVNVAPDKRKIFFSSESIIMCSLREAVENLYSPQQCSFSVNNAEDPEKEEGTVTDGHNEDTNSIPAENVSSPDNSDDKEETDSEDQVSPENQKEPSSAQADRSAWLPSFSYEQPKRLPKEGKGYASGANNFRTGLAAKSTHSPTVQSSLMNFVSLNKRKHEDDCDLVSEAPVLRRGTCLEQVRRTSLEANFVSPNKPDYTDDCCLISEAPVLRRGACSEQVRKTSFEGNIVSPNKKHKDTCGLISETPILRRGAYSEQVRRTSLDANSPAALSPRTSNISESNLPLETNSLKQQSPQAIVSEMADVSPHHSKPPNAVICGEEVSSPCDVDTTQPDVEELHGQSLSISGAPNKHSEAEYLNTLTDSPSPDANDSDNGAAVYSAAVQYPIMQFTVAGLKRRRKNGFMISHANKANCLEKTTRCYKAATLDIYLPSGEEAKSNSLAAATNELDRLFSKDDFGEMEVVGQFNLGFIIGKLDQDLFIVDQVSYIRFTHAADEKYNFEGLSQSTTLNIQPLLQPLRLDLSPEEEVIVSMNMNTIRYSLSYYYNLALQF
ncbi:hypothetical protein HU200_062399 [Digitaria exilis]|uniref:DNA mismatch repair protein S5 domain-containing protein n=1 Tax=Digitaria exilis TaxID=1010633 RepID=A0A835E0E0_9POAL|nr:hypothetical protein HU200_062399 [Digitaria exilis]